MDIFWLLVPCVVVSLSLVLLAERYVAFNKEFETVGKNKIQLVRLADYRPKKIRRQLQKDSHTKKAVIEHLLKSYKQLHLAVAVYIISNLAYIVCIIYRIAQVAEDYPSIKRTKSFNFGINIICFSIVLSYLLFMLPVAKILYGTKELDKLKSTLFELFKRIVLGICMFRLALFFCNLYILRMEPFLKHHDIGFTFSSVLAILIIYQYLLLFPISCVVHFFIWGLDKIFRKVFEKKWRKNKVVAAIAQGIAFCKQYAESGQLYPVLNNSTYLVFVLVHACATGDGPDGATVAGATGVLFLIDTFLAQEKAISDKVKSCSRKSGKK